MTQWLFPNSEVQQMLFLHVKLQLQWQDLNGNSCIYYFLLQTRGSSEGNCFKSYLNSLLHLSPTMSLLFLSSCYCILLQYLMAIFLSTQFIHAHHRDREFHSREGEKKELEDIFSCQNFTLPGFNVSKPSCGCWKSLIRITFKIRVSYQGTTQWEGQSCKPEAFISRGLNPDA